MATSSAPSLRAQGTAAVFDGFVVFGGSSAGVISNQMYKYVAGNEGTLRYGWLF
jgi:hypothetical protein